VAYDTVAYSDTFAAQAWPSILWLDQAKKTREWRAAENARSISMRRLSSELGIGELELA
jgi:hypothetical protein